MGIAEDVLHARVLVWVLRDMERSAGSSEDVREAWEAPSCTV
jgi:hypothetical protein